MVMPGYACVLFCATITRRKLEMEGLRREKRKKREAKRVAGKRKLGGRERKRLKTGQPRAKHTPQLNIGYHTL